MHNGPKRTISACGGLELLLMVSELDISQCANEDTRPQGGWIVRSHTPLRGERSIPYKGVETSPYKTRFKTVRLTAICNGSKRVISASGRLGLSLMVSGLNTG